MRTGGLWLRGDQAQMPRAPERVRHLGARCWGPDRAEAGLGSGGLRGFCPRAPSGREGAPSGGIPGSGR